MTGADYSEALKDAAFFAFMLGLSVSSIARLFRMFR